METQNQLKTTIKQEPVLVVVDEDDGGGGDGFTTMVPKPIEGLRDVGLPPFLKKTYDMVDDPLTDSIISWGASDDSFVLWDPHKFSTEILPRNFKHNNFSSFVRQLNTYRFKKIHPDRWEFANEVFRKGKRDLLKYIKRRSHRPQIMPQQEEFRAQHVNPLIGAELQKLKADRNALRLEMLNLKQQQELIEHRLEAARLQVNKTESKQRQLILFMAKAMRNPLFIQIIEQQLMTQRKELADGNLTKKRRLEQIGADPNEKKDLVHEQLNMIESEIQAMFSSEDSTSPSLLNKIDENGGSASPDYTSENFVLWEKLLEDEMILGNEAPEDHSEVLLHEFEGLIAEPFADK